MALRCAKQLAVWTKWRKVPFCKSISYLRELNVTREFFRVVFNDLRKHERNGYNKLASLAHLLHVLSETRKERIGEITRNKRQDKKEVSDQEGPTRSLDT